MEIELRRRFPQMRVNGDQEHRLPGNSSITIPGVDAEAVIANCPELALSTGSACTSGAPEPSHVLLALGLSRDKAYKTLRIGVGRFTTPKHIACTIELLAHAAARIHTLAIS
jgi:cysteine desulfurase